MRERLNVDVVYSLDRGTDPDELRNRAVKAALKKCPDPVYMSDAAVDPGAYGFPLDAQIGIRRFEFTGTPTGAA